MVGMRMDNFGGMIPRLSRRLLDANMASFVSNAHLKSGELRGQRSPFKLFSFPNVTPFHRAARVPDPAGPNGVYWQGFRSRNADFYPNPLKNDLHDRYIWLDDNGPGQPSTLWENSFVRMKNGDPAIILGVLAPVGAPSVSPTGGVGIAETRAYLYTFVNMFSEEGQPSPSTTAALKNDSTWTIAGFTVPGDYYSRGLTHIRIYRTITGGLGTQFYRVVDIPITQSSYADTRPDSVVAAEGLILQSTYWAMPEQMEGFLAMPNGFFAGWRGKDVFFSEPYRPWAWPVEYTLAIEYAVIDAGVIDQTFVALTKSSPALISGSHPSFMSISKSAYVEPCISPESIAQSPMGIFYASQNGLNILTSSGLVSVSKEAVLRTQWNNDYVYGMRCAAAFDGQYIAFTLPGRGFIFEPSNQQSGVVHLLNFMNVDNIWTDPYTSDALLISDNTVYAWSSQQASFLAAEWVSKEFQFTAPVNFGALMVTLQPGSEVITDPDGDLIDEEVIPVGGPWLDQSSIINYQTINGPYINEAPVWGSYPPGNGPPNKAWPHWYGVEYGGQNYVIPGGPFCRITIFANNDVVWQSLIEDGVVYRLPSGFKSDTWQVQITTRVPVLNVQIAETAKELARV